MRLDLWQAHLVYSKDINGSISPGLRPCCWRVPDMEQLDPCDRKLEDDSECSGSWEIILGSTCRVPSTASLS